MRHVSAVIALGACACGADLAAPDVKPSPVETVEVASCWAQDLVWMAVQSDAGPWTRVLPDAHHDYRATLTKRGGIAMVGRDNSGYRNTRVSYGTAPELKAQFSNCFPTVFLWNKSVTGTVAGVVDGTRAVVGLGSGRESFSSRTDYSILFEDGPRDLIALRIRNNSTWPTRLIVRRALNVADGSRIPLLDFDGVEATALAATKLTITGIGSEGAYLTSTFGTATSEGLYLITGAQAVPMQIIYSVPAALTLPGDYHDVTVNASSQTGWRMTLSRFRDAVDRTTSLGPPLAVPTTSMVAMTPNLRQRTQWTSQAEYADGAAVTWEQELPTGGWIAVGVLMTRDYLGGRPATWDAITPDLTVAGYAPAWGLQPGLQVTATTEAIGGNSFTQFIPANRTQEGTVRYAVRYGTAASTSIESRSRLSRQGLLSSRQFPIDHR